MIARALLMIFAIVFCFKAEAKDGRGIVYGSGMQSCGAWTKLRSEGKPALVAEYIIRLTQMSESKRRG